LRKILQGLNHLEFIKEKSGYPEGIKVKEALLFPQSDNVYLTFAPGTTGNNLAGGLH
jgi:hypothetical protein